MTPEHILLRDAELQHKLVTAIAAVEALPEATPGFFARMTDSLKTALTAQDPKKPKARHGQ